MRRALASLAVTLMALASTGCETTVYKIKAGDHYATHKVAVFTGDSLDFNVTFDNSAVYQTQDPQNQGDINKLYGFSDCSSHHHTNSARFGWRWYNNQLQLHAYTYVDGQRQSQLMGTVGLNETHHYAMGFEGDHYYFTLDDHTIEMPRGCDGDGGVKYRLYPYFGGDETAPHDMTIRINEN